ncbi:MAG: bacillithiol system protein YtxJ [Parvicellaceae bacterium]|jgi:bacillithiol system protein YtxJ
MGFFSRQKESRINWNDLSDISGIDKIINESKEHPVVIFKHSTRCSISSMAMTRLESNWDFTDEELPIYYLDLIANRDVSNAVALAFNVEHASPQVLLIKNGESVFNTSHNDIRSDQFKVYL